jgi:carbohydrate diacid regulator
MFPNMTRDYLHQELKHFQKNYGSSPSIGISKTVFCVDVKPAYEESLKAAKVAEKGRQIIFYEDLLLEIILEEVSIQTREEFTERIFFKISIKNVIFS